MLGTLVPELVEGVDVGYNAPNCATHFAPYSAIISLQTVPLSIMNNIVLALLKKQYQHGRKQKKHYGYQTSITTQTKRINRKVAFYLRISRNTVNGYVKFFNGLRITAGSYRLMMPS